MNLVKNSLIVLNYNDSDTTLRFLKMALSCPSIDQIIAVDNCSTDDSFERLRELSNDHLHVIRTKKNGGYAYGNNFGCRYALRMFSPNVLFLANPDTSFTDDVISKMQCALCSTANSDTNDSTDQYYDPPDSRNNVALAVPLVNQGYNIWNIPDYLGVLRSVFLFAFFLEKKRIKFQIQKEKRTGISCFPIGVAEGSFFAIRSDCYTQIGGLDERTFLYYEENILAKRLVNAGFSSVVLPGCRYDHFHSISIKKQYGTKAKAFLQFHPSMLLYLKEYLHINLIQRALFEICFLLGFLERILYDLVGGRKVTERI